jgi:hypothetical protein
MAHDVPPVGGWRTAHGNAATGGETKVFEPVADGVRAVPEGSAVPQPARDAGQFTSESAREASEVGVMAGSGLPMRRNRATLPSKTVPTENEFPQTRPAGPGVGRRDGAGPAIPTALLYRCRRCGETVAETHSAPEVALRQAIARGATLTVHECPDGASGVADLIGTGPGRPQSVVHDARPAGAANADC